VESLRVEKRRAAVDVFLVDGTRRMFEFFLAASSGLHSGAERLSDLLSKRATFIPARDGSTGGITWLNTTNIVTVRATPDFDPQPDFPTLPTEHELEIHLAMGATVRGLVSYVRPEEYSRITDILNHDDQPFLRLLDDEKVVFVNKQHVVRVLSGRP
jgi:hypothetical protein